MLLERICGSQNTCTWDRNHYCCICKCTYHACNIIVCVCDIAMCVRDISTCFLGVQYLYPLYSCENTGLSSHSSCLSVHIDITTLFTVVKEKRQMVLVPCFLHFDLIILFVVIDGHLALSYGRYSHTVSRILLLLSSYVLVLAFDSLYAW